MESCTSQLSRDNKLSNSVTDGGSVSVAGRQYVCSNPEVPCFSGYSTLFVLVILVTFLRIELICLCILHQMNTFWQYEVGGQNLSQFLTWQNYLGLIGQGIQARILYYRESRLKEIFFSLQKLSFLSGNIGGGGEKIEIQIIFNNTFFQFMKFFAGWKFNFPST